MRRAAPLALFLLASCASTLYVQHQQATLFFGTAKPDKSVVTVAEWDAFVAEVITPKFPGFTILDSTGYWKGERESGKVVIFVDGGGREAGIQFVMDEYKRRFQQEAVLLVRQPVWVRFY